MVNDGKTLLPYDGYNVLGADEGKRHCDEVSTLADANSQQSLAGKLNYGLGQKFLYHYSLNSHY